MRSCAEGAITALRGPADRYLTCGDGDGDVVDGRRRDRLARMVAECVTAPEWVAPEKGASEGVVHEGVVPEGVVPEGVVHGGLASGEVAHGGVARAVCAVCVRAVPGVDAAAVTLRGDSRTQQLLGASNRWAAALEEVQYTVGEGPGVEAFTTGGPVLVADLSAQRGRWPGFAELGEDEGLAAVFAFPLQLGGSRLGTLDLYRRRPGGLSSDAVLDAAVLADLTVLALLRHGETTGDGRLRVEVSYQDVDIATGMLAAQLRVSPEDAFARLRAHAFAAGRSVLEVAREVLARRLPPDHLAD